MTDDERFVRVMRFCEALEAQDAGSRARLKRCAGRTLAQSPEVLGLFYRLLPPGVPAWHEEHYYLLATLFPVADAADTGSLGAALARARNDQNGRGLDRRIEALLDADESQLPFRVRQSIRFLQSCRVGVEWPRLLQDLLQWTHPERHVQKTWARDYFAARAAE
jgi:CRISPR type I-E-associated protein CasB/Cse2